MNQYPRHDIDPAKKDAKWIMSYAKAAWQDFQSMKGEIFYRARDKYEEYMDYVLGKQSIDRYKKQLEISDAEDKSWMNIDWSIRPIGSKFIDIALAKLYKRNFNIIATPIDPLAKDEGDKYYAGIKSKILLREQLMQIDPELGNSPQLMPEVGEPEDMEELEMKMNYGFKHNMAIEAEQAIQLALYQNEINARRRAVLKRLLCFGVGGYKDYLDASGRVKFRDVDPQKLITSYCEKDDFSDAVHIGEVIQVKLSELSSYFTPTELEDIQKRTSSSMELGRQSFWNQKDDFKVDVLDIVFYSYDTSVLRRRQNEEGNIVYKESVYSKKNSDRKVLINGKEVEMYVPYEAQMIYKCKWIIGTDFLYEYGLETNIKRYDDHPSQCEMPYHLQAANFHKMKALGLVEKMIPLIDEYQLTVYKIQNFKNRWIPYIVDIDLGALESVGLGKGGAALTPKAVLDLMFQKFILPGRRNEYTGANVNYKAVDIRPTGMHQEFVTLAQDLARILNEMRDIAGLNEVTDGSTPPERMLTGGFSMANEATNNALHPYVYADKSLMERLSKSLMKRTVQAVKKGDVKGIMRALGDNTVKFIQVSPDVSLYEWGIMIEDKPSDDDIQVLMQQMGITEQSGLIEPEDIFMIRSLSNIKQMEQMLAYRVKKRKKQKLQESMTLQQQNAEVQMQSAQAAELEKQKTLQLEYDLKLRNEMAVKEKEKEIAMIKVGGQLADTEQKMQQA